MLSEKTIDFLRLYKTIRKAHDAAIKMVHTCIAFKQFEQAQALAEIAAELGPIKHKRFRGKKHGDDSSRADD
jgi:hypothetical protein